MRRFQVEVCAVLLFSFSSALADEFKLTPTIALRQEYVSNVFFDSQKEKDDFITRVRAGVEIAHLTERIETRFSGFVVPSFYWEEDDLNAVDQDYSGRGSLRLTPRFTIEAEAAVHVDHYPDRDIATTGLAYGENRRIRQNYTARGSFATTELWTMTGSYNHRREDWRARGDETIEDWSSHTATWGHVIELGGARGMTQGLLEFGFSSFDYETSDSRSPFATVGIRHRLSEPYAVTAIAGVRYIDTDYTVRRSVFASPGTLSVVEEKESERSWKGLTRLSLDYSGERFHATASASHDIDPSSGRSGVVQRTGGSVSLGYLILERLRAGLYAGVFRNKSETDQFTENRVNSYTYDLIPSLRLEFARDFTFEAGYGFIYVDERNEGEGDAYRHLIFVQLAWGIPLME